MGISHPLSDALRGAVLSPDRSSPSSSFRASDDDYLQHQVSRMDTLAGVAIKYAVQISDIKKANCLVSDSQMFAHKTLLIPPPGRPIPSSVRLNGSGQSTKRPWASSHQQNRDSFGSLDSPKSCRQGTSPAMSTMQGYYGLTSYKGSTTDCSTEIQSMACERLLNSSAAPGTPTSDRSWDRDDPENVFSAPTGAKSKGADKPKQDGSLRRRQMVEEDPDFLADPIKAIKSILPRPISSICLNTNTSSTESSQKSNISSLNGFRSMRKSPSTPSFDSLTRPLLDGLPKPATGRRTKTAMD